VLDRRDALALMLDTLPTRHRDAIHFFYFADLAAEDIAWYLGGSPERARQTLADAEAMMQGLARTCFRHLCVNGGGG
jgi:DNA-directed RNA polymerase specialized sigma24 family protein